MKDETNKAKIVKATRKINKEEKEIKKEEEKV